MNSKEYIIQKIDQLANEFPRVKFSYQFDNISDTHFIEVLPKKFFEKYDTDFLARQNQIVLDFIEEFSEEGLAFVTKGSLFEVNNPEFIICKNESEFEKPNLSWNYKELNKLLTKFKPEIQQSFVFYQEIIQVKQNPIFFKFNLKENTEQANFEFLTNNLPAESTNTDMCLIDEIIEDVDFCLAA